MSRAFINLLSADHLASRFGRALNPRLCAAIEAELGLRAKSSGPIIAMDETTAVENFIDLRAYAQNEGAA